MNTLERLQAIEEIRNLKTEGYQAVGEVCYAVYSGHAGHIAERQRRRGHYHDTYLRTAGVWRVATLSLTRLRLDTT